MEPIFYVIIPIIVVVVVTWNLPSRQVVREVQRNIAEGNFEVIYDNITATKIRINGVNMRVFDSFIGFDVDPMTPTTFKTRRLLREQMGGEPEKDLLSSLRSN